MGIEPPIWHVSGTTQLVAGCLFGAVLVATLVQAGRAATRDRSPYPFCIVLAAGLICLGEPFVDVLGQCMFPTQDVVGYVDTFGRQIPLYMAPVYFFYFGSSILWTVRRVAAGVTVHRWWRGYAALAAFGLCFEPLFLHLGWWTYYGDNQPLRFFGLPMWWGFANTAASITAGVFALFLMRHLRLTGWRNLLLVPVLPVAFMGFHTMLAFPIYTALNATTNTLLTNLAQLVTVALSVFMIWVTGRLVAVDSLDTRAAVFGDRTERRAERETVG